MGESSLGEPAGVSARIVVFSRDLFFGMRIRTTLRQLGFATVLTKEIPAFDTAVADASHPPALAIVDFNQPVSWDAMGAVRSGVPILAFGAHTDVDGFRAAKAAGVARVVSNGAFSRSLPELIERYAVATP